MKKSGFKENVVYTPKATTSVIIDKKQGKRKIIWFNSPYSVNVKTNISKFSKETFYEKEQVTKYFQ